MAAWWPRVEAMWRVPGRGRVAAPGLVADGRQGAGRGLRTNTVPRPGGGQAGVAALGADGRLGANRGLAGDGGQATLLMVGMLFVMVVLTAIVAQAGSLLAQSARARTAADAAALAGAAEGRQAAAELAQANGAALVSYRIGAVNLPSGGATTGTTGSAEAVAVTVRVQHGQALESARAVAQVSWKPPS